MLTNALRSQCDNDCGIYEWRDVQIRPLYKMANRLNNVKSHSHNLFACRDKHCKCETRHHYDDVIMDAIASQITSLTIIYSTVYSDADQSKHQSSASLAFVRGIHRWPVNSPHKGPVTRKMFPFEDVIMIALYDSSTRKGSPKFMSTENYNSTVTKAYNLKRYFASDVSSEKHSMCKNVRIITGDKQRIWYGIYSAVSLLCPTYFSNTSTSHSLAVYHMWCCNNR